MRKNQAGVLHCGTPLFLLMLLCLLGLNSLFNPSSAFAGQTVAGQGNTQTATGHDKVTLFADHFKYAQEQGYLYAEGKVRVWYGDITLTADTAEADLESNLVQARGNVVLTEEDRTIHCAQMKYDLETRSAQMEGIHFATYPWYYQGEKIEKIGDDKVIISNALFTTCNARHPHFHLTAQQIDIVLNESLTAHHAVLYVGTTPLFYLPWIHRSLKDSRPPFSIRVGYNDFEGFFAKLKFNYFLVKDNYGAVLLDFMEKKGVGVGLEHHAEYDLLGHGKGDVSVLYVKDDAEQVERWTANLTNRHEFSDRDLLQINADYLSDRSFNRDFSYDLVDSFQQKSYISYSHRGDSFYLSLGASDVESWNPTTESYYTSSRELPTASFSITSRKVTDWRFPIYFNLSSNLSRTFNRLDWISTDIHYRYADAFTVTPGFTQTYTFPIYVPTQPSLSGSISFPTTGSFREELFEVYDGSKATPGNLDTSYTTRITLTNKWVNYRYTKPTHLMQTRLSHEYSQKYALTDPLAWDRGLLTTNRVGLAGDYYMGDFLTLQASSGYNLLLAESLEMDEIPDWKQRLEGLSFSGRARISSALSFNWQGQHDWLKERITTAYASSSYYGKAWNLSLRGSYSYLGTETQDHSLFTTISAGLRPGIGISLTSGLQYDVVKQEFTNFSLNLSHDLHCWDLQAGFKIYADGNLELGLGLTLKAFPDITVGMGGPSGVSVGE